MSKILLLVLFVFVVSCGFKETNPLAIPPIAKDVLKVEQ
jgi:predicted small lipoprotein YifL